MEIFLILLQVFLQFFGELLLYILGEILIGSLFQGMAQLLGFSWTPSVLDRPAKTHPVVAIFGYGLLGAFVGGLTLLMFPTAFVQNPFLRLINLFFSPVLVGLLMVMLGKRQTSKTPASGKISSRSINGRVRRQDPTEVHRFSCGFAFAFAIALVRFLWFR